MKPSQPAHRSLPHIADFSLGEDVDLVIGLTAAALAGNEVARLAKSHQHQGSHLVKAGLSAAVAATALKMMQREHQDNRDHHGHHDGRSREHPGHHHSRGTLEENEHHHHKHHGSSGHHNEAQHPRDNERHSDYSVHNIENHTHHNRRHSLDSVHTLKPLPMEHDNHGYPNRPQSTHTPAPSQSSGHSYTIPQSRASPKDIMEVAPLRSPDFGHHHVHFSDDDDQDSFRSSR